MLRGISPLISPDLLRTLAAMGHGDEIVFCDAHFPAEAVHPRVIRADGLCFAPLLEAILPLFVLDSYDPSPVIMMAAVEGDRLNPAVERHYQLAIQKSEQPPTKIVRLERFAFYERAKRAFAVVATGDTTQYANIILKKGVTPSL